MKKLWRKIDWFLYDNRNTIDLLFKFAYKVFMFLFIIYLLNQGQTNGAIFMLALWLFAKGE